MMQTDEKTLTIVTDEAARELLSEAEMQDICQAYQAGARGSLIIALKGRERILTQLLPAVANKDEADQQLERCTAILKRIRCDRYIRIARARLRGKDTHVLSISLTPCETKREEE